MGMSFTVYVDDTFEEGVWLVLRGVARAGPAVLPGRQSRPEGCSPHWTWPWDGRA